VRADVGVAMTYERLMRHRDDDERLEVDAVLGMPGAQAELDRRRMETVADPDLGFEVG
jgi:hypothetical protein